GASPPWDRIGPTIASPQAGARAIFHLIGGLETMPCQLPPLPYAPEALEPNIDAQTMQIHHDRHHATYVNNLNGAIEKHPELQGKSLEELLRNINTVPEDIRTVVRN